MDLQQLQCLIESILFVATEPVELSRLQGVLGVDQEHLEEALHLLGDACRQRGLRLQRIDNTVQLVTASEAAPYVEKFLDLQANSKLSSAALETLAIVAYRQPITRAGIEDIRGVNVDRALSTLQARGLIREVGRLPTVGRPILYGTTPEFLQYFGLESLDQLPPLEEQS
ncbi:MAG: SMC-Scp complex subunit ScpB [Chloroflexi bacterium]|nr:SMC-Scp complex subunit ScpB [Chloroflexota bacterium]MCL5076354.1 SMC-Scp complex subunit ScpB [Chloroflexota bacterium]